MSTRPDASTTMFVITPARRAHPRPGHQGTAPLSPTGVAQASAVASRFVKEGLTRILSGTSNACVQTVRPLARRLQPLQVQTTNRLDVRGESLDQLALRYEGEKFVVCAEESFLKLHLSALAKLSGRPELIRALGPAEGWAITFNGSELGEATAFTVAAGRDLR